MSDISLLQSLPIVQKIAACDEETYANFARTNPFIRWGIDIARNIMEAEG